LLPDNISLNPSSNKGFELPSFEGKVGDGYAIKVLLLFN